jgi:hypothetical protein
MNPGHDGPEPDARPGLSTAPAEAPAPVDFTSRARCAFPVVGIGASAGGIDALRAFFTATTPIDDFFRSLAQEQYENAIAEQEIERHRHDLGEILDPRSDFFRMSAMRWNVMPCTRAETRAYG